MCVKVSFSSTDVIEFVFLAEDKEILRLKRNGNSCQKEIIIRISSYSHLCSIFLGIRDRTFCHVGVKLR
jgi:hypothetical protein